MLRNQFNKLTAFLIFISAFGCKENENIKTSEIDSIENQLEVQNLIRKNFKDLLQYEVKRIQNFKRYDLMCQANVKLADELDVEESFYKADFDNNGYTDLLVIGDDHTCFEGQNQSCSYTPLVILNLSNKKYKIARISQKFDDYFVPKITNKNGQVLLEINRAQIADWKKKTVSKDPQKQILAFKHDAFIEYNSNDKNYIPIQKIEFSTDGCYGTCPVFDLEISKNQEAKFIAKNFNFNEKMEEWSTKNEGTFRTKIKNKDFDILIKTLEYIDFPELKDRYSVDWTDDQTVTLRITYANRKVKIINDYGACGTYGLIRVYNLLFDLRKNQNWIKIE